MREAIGGTLLMYIVLFFLFVYIAFMAVVINYGRVFRVKNTLISTIENNEGFSDTSSADDLKALAGKMGYHGKIFACYTKNDANNTYYFAIKLYISFDLPLVADTINIPITGETSAIRGVKGKRIEGSIPSCNPSGDKFPSSNI